MIVAQFEHTEKAGEKMQWWNGERGGPENDIYILYLFWLKCLGERAGKFKFFL